MSLNIYAAHASSFDYQSEFYQPLKQSEIAEQHTLILPHDDSEEQFDSYKLFHTDCDLVIAEVTHASTGLGIELGWAYEADIPIICVHTEDSEPTSALTAVTKMVYSYSSPEDMITVLQENWRKL